MAESFLEQECERIHWVSRIQGVRADLERMWPVEDLLDAEGLIVVTRKRLMDHFVQAVKRQISLRELMDMCLDAPVEGLDFMMPPLLRVYGFGKKWFWPVVNRLTGMDLGSHPPHHAP